MCLPPIMKHLTSNSKIFHKAIRKGDLKIVLELLRVHPELVHGDWTYSPLWIAVTYERYEIVKLLVERGADVKYKDSLSNETLLSWLVKSKKKHTKLIKLLIHHGADVNFLCPLRYTVRHGKIEYTKLLLENGANLVKSLLFVAALSPTPEEMIRLLVEYGVDVNERKFGRNILHCLSSDVEVDLKVVELLIKQGASLEETDNRGYTPLHYAAKGNRGSTINLFLKYKANVNARSGITEETPLFLLVDKADNGSIIDLLVDYGAIVDARTKLGQTPLHKACESLKQSNIRKLLERGARVDVLDEAGKSPFALLNPRDRAHRPTVKFMIKEFAKMTLTNMPVDPGDLKIISENTNLQSFYQECLEELESMKEMKFYDMYSIYFIVTHWKDKRRLARLIGNEDFFSGLVSCPDVKKIFHYAEDLHKILNDAVTTLWTLGAMKYKLDEIIGNRLPELVKHVILGYLKPRDLFLVDNNL